MSVTLARLRRVVSSRSADELRVRLGQRMSILLERVYPSPAWRETADAVFNHVLRTRGDAGTHATAANSETASHRPRIAWLDGDLGAIGELCRTRFPEASSQLVARAERATNDRFDILGHEGLSYGDPIDWHLDPLRHRRAPLCHWSRVPYLDVAQVGDHKVIWELNRHQHLVTLGQAYCLTGDERYVATVVRHLSEWMNANPAKLGINWSSSLELAFRAISWTWALHLVRRSEQISQRFMSRVLKFLYIHAKHIEAHLSTYFSPNTHLTGEALGLMYVGTCFDEFLDAPRWRELGWSILERELGRQVRADGIYFEQTTWYQRYTADFYLHALQLCEQCGLTVSDDVRRRINQLIDPLVYFTDPSGLTPLIGDDDGGQLLALSPAAASDFRATLVHAAVLLERPDCAALGVDAASCLPWLTGECGMALFDAIERRVPSANARLFPDGGYFVARDHWSSDADFLVVDCGPHGSLSFGHAHADSLAFELTLGGVPVLVDPGTYTYAEPERDEFRTTAAHNTLTVDELPSSEPDRPFRWRSAARCTLFRAISNQQYAFFEGEHDGYTRLPDPARLRRAIFARFGEFVVVLDAVGAVGAHNIAGRYHFSPGLVVTHNGMSAVTASARAHPSQPLVDLLVMGPEVTLELEPGRVAPTYGVALDAHVAVFSANGAGTRHFWTVVVPRRRGGREPALIPAVPQSGRGIILQSGEFEDVLIASDNGSQLDDLSTDADWVWIRRTLPRAQAIEFVVLNASRLELDGQSVVSLPDRRQHVRGRWLETGWELHVSAT